MGIVVHLFIEGLAAWVHVIFVLRCVTALRILIESRYVFSVYVPNGQVLLWSRADAIALVWVGLPSQPLPGKQQGQSAASLEDLGS